MLSRKSLWCSHPWLDTSSSVAFALLGWLLLAGVVAAADPLEDGFRQPPASARPWVYWFPLDGNITSNGITADLEAMKRVGIGGVLYMETEQGTPRGPAKFAGPLWRNLFKHLVAEADLAQPTAVRNFYQDIAVFAYPTPASDYSIPQCKTRASSGNGPSASM